MSEWLSDDIALTVAKFLGFRDFARLMSTCTTARHALKPQYASRAFPHILKHMTKLLRSERLRTQDEAFELEDHGLNEHVMVYSGPVIEGNLHKSYYDINVNRNKNSDLNTINISVNRRMFTPEINGELFSYPMGFSQAVISPSLEDPFNRGRIYSVAYIYCDTETGREVVCQYKRTEEYNEGFQRVIHRLACILCPLEQSELYV
jgi:hypothetical protein